jgi:transcriptional regulator with XRE-family HTH domain
MLTLRVDVPKHFNRAVGSQLRQARTLRQMSQRDLSRGAFLRKESVSKYENGIHPPTVRSLHRMAQALGLPADCLLPEISLNDPADQFLYTFLRNIWFAPLETRRVVAALLSCCASFQQAAPLTWLRPAGGGQHASHG